MKAETEGSSAHDVQLQKELEELKKQYKKLKVVCNLFDSWTFSFSSVCCLFLIFLCLLDL